MTDLAKIGIALGIFALVLLIINVIEIVKSKEEINGAMFKRKISGVGRAFGYLFRAFAGTPPPQEDFSIITGDRDYWKNLTKSEVLKAWGQASEVMKSIGFELDSHKSMALDCENFSYTAAGLATFFIVKNRIDNNIPVGNKGIPAGVIAYTRNDGRRHAVQRYLVNGKQFCLEGYPEYPNELLMTPAELDSIFVDVLM